ncbi:MAG: type IV pilus secretin PilQ [Thermosulfidibacteraceae bacterium]
MVLVLRLFIIFLVFLLQYIPDKAYSDILQIMSLYAERDDKVRDILKQDKKVSQLLEKGFCVMLYKHDRRYKVLVDVDGENLPKLKKDFPKSFLVREEALKLSGYSFYDSYGNCSSVAKPSNATRGGKLREGSKALEERKGSDERGKSLADVMNELETFSVRGDSVYLYGRGVWQYVEAESIYNPLRVIVKLFNTKYTSRLNDILFPLSYVDRLRILYDDKNRTTMVVFYLSAPMRVALEKDGRVIKVNFVPDGLEKNRISLVGKGKVSFDLRNAEIGDVLRIFSEVVGINFVVDPEVKGNVTMRMVQVDAMKALDAILKSLGLIKLEYDTNIYRITTLDKLAKEIEKEDEVSPIITKVFRFKNISVAALEGEGKCGILSETRTITTTIGTSTTTTTGSEEDKCRDLREAFKVLMSPKGRMEIIQSINGIVVTDRKNRVEIIERLLKEIDAPKPQIQINARMVEVSSNYAKELGIQWGFLWRQSRTSINFPHSFEIGGVIGNSTLKDVATRLPVGFVVDLPANVGVGRGASLAATLLNTKETFGIDVRLSALEDRGLAKTISSPRIITMDNSPAVIVQGFQIPYKVATQDRIATQFIVAALRLKVIPHITDDGAVLMEVVVSKDSPDFTNITPDGVPIKVREVKTRVKLRQGETLVIGGIYEITSGSSTNSVPGLSRVPLLKWLFTHEMETLSKTEVLVFITPTVLRNFLN